MHAMRSLRTAYMNWLNKSCRNVFQDSVDDMLEEGLSAFLRDTGIRGSSDAAISAIVSRMKVNGYVILPGAIRGAALENLRSEFKKLIDSAGTSNYRVDRGEGAVCMRVKPRSSLRVNEFPATAAFFSSDVLRRVAELFYDGNKDIRFNSEIFVHETPPTDSPLSGAMHWDRTQQLKFWIYVEDVPLEAGPMRIERRTVERNRRLRIEAHKLRRNLIGGVHNVVDVDAENVVSLSAPAGSVLIHDTDATHGAGEVKNGFVRRIMRGHCRAS